MKQIFLNKIRASFQIVNYTWFCFLIIFVVLVPKLILAQSFELLIIGGHVIDPINEINSQYDIAIADGKIARVTKNIPESDAGNVVNATGYYVNPGLINMHAIVFFGSGHRTFANGFNSISPDDFSFRSGITTIADGGTSGWRNFAQFKVQDIDESDTRILAFLNISGSGMKDMLNIMSKFFSLGMDLEDIIYRATWKSAKSIKCEDLGHLSEGADVDIAVIKLRDGDFGYLDAAGYVIDGNQKLEAELTIRAGQVAWDLNGMAAERWKIS